MGALNLVINRYTEIKNQIEQTKTEIANESNQRRRRAKEKFLFHTYEQKTLHENILRGVRIEDQRS